MTDVTLSIPDDILDNAQRIAANTAQTVEQVLLNGIKIALPLPALAPDEESELAALQHLSNDTLQTIAAEKLPLDIQAQMETLMDRNSRGSITPQEYEELAALVERGERLMLRKAEAAAILRQRSESR